MFLLSRIIPSLPFLLISLTLVTFARASNPYVGSAEALNGFDAITPAQMEELRGKKILFASRSFGLNTYNGLNLLKNQDSDYDLLNAYIRYNVFGNGSDLSIVPGEAFDNHNLVHVLATYWPHTKRLEEVETLMRDAPWNFGDKVDVVIIFYHTALPGMYDTYIQKMSALEAEFPDVKFVYVCSGYMGPSRSTDNQNSYEFGELMRANQRGNVPLYDMAAILSKDDLESKQYVAEYSTDAADVHPNTDAGEMALAKGFLVMLKELYFAAQGEAPTAPAGLSAVAASESTIDLSWSASTITEGSVSYYRILRDGGLVTTTTNTSYTDSGLNEGTGYTYTVNAVSNGGVHSGPSNEATAQTLADNTAPTLVSAADTDVSTQIVLTFSETLEATSAETAGNYTIPGVTVIAASLSGDTVTLTTSPLAEATTYTVSVSNVTDNSSANNPVDAGAQDTFRYVPPAVPTPIGHWSFDGTLDDAYGQHAQWRDGTDSYATGRIGQALYQDGTASGPYVLISNHASHSGMTALSLSLWAKKNSAATGGQVLKKHTAYDLIIGQSTVSGYVFNESGTRYNFNVSVPAIDDTGWHHYSLVYDGSTLKIFVDGLEVDSQNVTGAVATTSQSIYVGKLPWSNQLTFNGQIDELKLFDAAIDPAIFYAADQDHAAVQALLDANNVGRTVEGVSVKDDTGRIIELYIQEAGISGITADIGQLTELQVLHCYGDRALGQALLTSIDPAIASCTKLQTLFINQNDLTTLPSAITALTTLTALSAGENKLADISDPVRTWLGTYDPDWLSSQLNYTPDWDEYKSRHFTPAEAADPLISGDNMDPDDDRLPNLIEYFLQSDPTTPNNRSYVDTGVMAGKFTIRMNRIRDERNLSLQWLHSDNLVDWFPVTPASVTIVQDHDTHVEAAYEFELAGNSDCWFFRLSVQHASP